MKSLSAHTSQAREWLPPVDTVHAVLKTKSGAIGTYVQSAGSSASAFEFQLVFEDGSIEAEGRKCVVIRGHGPDAKREEKAFEPSWGVLEEVRAWGEALQAGKPNPAQSPEEAIADLELLEQMLTSGDQNGAPQQTKHQ